MEFQQEFVEKLPVHCDLSKALKQYNTRCIIQWKRMKNNKYNTIRLDIMRYNETW